MLVLALYTHQDDRSLFTRFGTNKSLSHASQPTTRDPELLRMPEVLATLELIISPQQGIAGPSESHHSSGPRHSPGLMDMGWR